MPEGPGVKRTIDWLNNNLKGSIIENIEFLNQSEKYENQLQELIDILPVKVISYNCKGKFIYWNLNWISKKSNLYLAISLGLKGAFVKRIITKSISDNDKLSEIEPNIYYNDSKNLINNIFSAGDKATPPLSTFFINGSIVEEF